AHALAAGDLPGEAVLDRVARLVARDGGVGLGGGAGVAEPGPDGTVARVAVVRVDHVAGAAAGTAVVARVVVGAQEPQVRVVEAGLGQVDHRHRDPRAGGRAAVGLLDVGAARLLQALDQPQRVGQAGLGEGGVDVAAAALEHAEDVGLGGYFPGRQREQLRQDAARRHFRRRFHRVLHGAPLAEA